MAAGNSRAPHVSVVIPVYNDAEWIGETLDSVLKQTLPAEQMEVIVVNDGSTDDSRRIAQEKLGGADVASTVLSIKNSGPSRARNVGWREAQAPWIQFLDADDCLHERKLSRHLEATEDIPVETAVLYSDFQVLERNGDSWRAIRRRTPRIGDDTVKDVLSTQGFIQLGSAFFRRDWLDRIDGFDEQYDLVEDVNLMLRLAMAGGAFAHVPGNTPLSSYRQVKHSFSARHPKAHTDAIVRNARLAEQHWKHRNALTPERRDFLTEIYFQSTRTYAARRDDTNFHRVWSYIRSFNPDAVPNSPWMLRWLSQLVGYPLAERIARRYRQLKAYFPGT